MDQQGWERVHLLEDEDEVVPGLRAFWAGEPRRQRDRDRARHLFLASDEASFITGTHLMVDGGYTAR